MMSKMICAPALLGVLALAACGADEAEVADPPADSSSAAATTEETPAGPPFAELHDEYAADLEVDDALCQVTGGNPTACRSVLAGGLDAANAVADALAGFERAPTSPVDNVLDAVDQVRFNYDKYDDDPNCFSLEMMNSAGLELDEVQTLNLVSCSAEATTVAYNLQSVAAVLSNSAKEA